MFEPSKRDKKYMNLAAKIAAGSTPHGGARVVAVIALRNDVLSVGINSSKTHPFQAKYRKNQHAMFWHAETRAISNAIKTGHGDLLKRSSMYILRLTNAGNIGISKPCCGCAMAISNHNVGRVLYTTAESNLIDCPHMEPYPVN